MVKVAVVGTDRQHLEAWSAMNHAEVVAVVPGNKNEEIPEAYSGQLISNAQDLQTMDVDVIDVCVPVNERAEWIQQLSKEGLHIICETPLSELSEESISIIKACEAKKMHLYVGNKRRFSPEYADARNQVSNGNIGKNGVVRISSGSPHPGGQEDIFSGLGMAEFDWLLWTFGEVERVMARHVKRERLDGTPVEYALVTLRFKDQSFAHVELSWAKEKTETSFEIAGDKGMLTHNSNESDPISLQLSGTAEEALLKEAILIKSVLQRQFEHVVALAEVKDKPVIAADDALKPFQVAEAARKSARTGQPVTLEEVLT